MRIYDSVRAKVGHGMTFLEPQTQIVLKVGVDGSVNKLVTWIGTTLFVSPFPVDSKHSFL